MDSMHAHLRAAKRPADATRHVESAATTSRRLCGEHARGVTPGLPSAPGAQKRAHTIIAYGERTFAARPDERCAEMCATRSSLCTIGMPDLAAEVIQNTVFFIHTSDFHTNTVRLRP